MAITRDEFEEWQQHPVTKQFKKNLREQADEMKELLTGVSEEGLRALQERYFVVRRLEQIEYEDLYSYEHQTSGSPLSSQA